MSKDKKKPKELFIYKPQSVCQDKRLTSIEQDYLCLIAQLQKAGGCTASNNYFARYFGVWRVTAVRIIGRLKAKKFIACQEKKIGRQTIERTIEIIDGDSNKVLLRGSNKLLPGGVVTKQARGSNKSVTLTIEGTTEEYNKERPTSDDVRLASLLFSEIRKRKPDYKTPDLKKWAKHIDRMIRLDGRNPARIAEVIRWCQADEGDGSWQGWQNNILCTEKLREKFDALELRMGKNNGSNKNSRKFAESSKIGSVVAM